MTVSVTDSAITQIQHSQQQGGTESMPLRIAIDRKPDGSLHYLMGFDDKTMPDDDEIIVAKNVSILLDNASKALAKGMMMDYVEIEGKPEFIFLNPNDPNYKAPTTS